MRRPGRRGLTEVEKGTWEAYARAVAPLPGRDAPPLPSVPEPPQPAGQTLPAATGQRQPAPELAVGALPAGLDAASWRRLRRGRLPAARQLDLHGFTAQRAFLAVSHFLRAAQADHVRCVEIVTGRGGAEGGVLRRELPFWLNRPELRPLVLAAAHPHATNQGAVRLLLRRPR